MPQIITQDGQALTWTAKYWRYHSQHSETCESLEEAVRFLEYGEDDGALSSESILGPDGKVLYEFGRLSIWDVVRQLEEESA